MTFDAVTVIAVALLVSALVSTRRPARRMGVWRSSYASVALALLHVLFLYGYITPPGAFSAEAWAAITAATIAGLATDDDADAVGVLMAGLGAFQVLLLAGILKLS